MYVHGHGCIMNLCFRTLIFLSASIHPCLHLCNISVSGSIYIHGFLLSYCTSLALSLVIAVSLKCPRQFLFMFHIIPVSLSFLQPTTLSVFQTTSVCLSNCSCQCLSFKLPLSLFITISVSLSNYDCLSL